MLNKNPKDDLIGRNMSRLLSNIWKRLYFDGVGNMFFSLMRDLQFVHDV